MRRLCVLYISLQPGGILMLLCVDLSFINDIWNFLILLLNKYNFVSNFVARSELFKQYFFPFQLPTV